MKKPSLINGESPEVGNAQQANWQLQRLSEKAPERDEAIVRPTAITKGNGRDRQK